MTEKKEQSNTQKKEDTALYVRPRACKFDESDLPVIYNLTALGYDPTQIGLILGYMGENWIRSACQTLPEYKEAIEMGLKAADAAIVKNLVKEAFGYDWEEVRTKYVPMEEFNAETGEYETQMIKVGETRTKKRQPGNARLAELLAVNRLPGDFKKVSEVKKASLDVKGELTETQMDQLIGKLLEAVKGNKVIESKVVENGERES